MKQLTLALAAAATSLGVAAPAAAPVPIEGRWARGNMQIRIAPCGQTLCGTVLRASDKQKARAEAGSGTDLVGATLIHHIRAVGPGRYTAKVFVADKNMNANGTIVQVSPDELNVKGCVAFGLFCKSQQWTRIGR